MVIAVLTAMSIAMLIAIIVAMQIAMHKRSLTPRLQTRRTSVG